ncbi:MAG: DUF2179 domain-containing protein, partial [Mailhella sp.]|nr:DUF2179 domain-containing protein [Mailhella sp.]
SFEHHRRRVVYSVVSGDESKREMSAVRAIDPDDFMNTFKSDEIRGLFYQRPTE